MYSQIGEVRDLLKEDVLNTLIRNGYIENPEEQETLILPLIEQAIQDADGEIDGYLAKRYPVPLAPVPKVIGKFSKDMAVYNLFSRIGIDEQSAQKNYLNRYRAAIKFLELLAEGKVSLGVEGGNGPGEAAKTGFSIRSNPRLFSRDNLRGM